MHIKLILTGKRSLVKKGNRMKTKIILVVLLLLSGFFLTNSTAYANRITVSSTSYCDHGTMANGNYTHYGAVAMNTVPLGTKIKVLTGEHAGGIYVVEDHIGFGSDLDFWTPQCSDAIRYGRQTVEIEIE